LTEYNYGYHSIKYYKIEFDMNKMLIKITGIFLILSISGIYANPNGKNIFNSKGCTACH
jgi:uncharacterized membrane protein